MIEKILERIFSWVPFEACWLIICLFLFIATPKLSIVEAFGFILIYFLGVGVLNG